MLQLMGIAMKSFKAAHAARLGITTTEATVAGLAVAAGAGAGYYAGQRQREMKINAGLDGVLGGLTGEKRAEAQSRMSAPLFNSVAAQYGALCESKIKGRDVFSKLLRDFRSKYNTITANAALVTLMLAPEGLVELGEKPKLSDLEAIVEKDINLMAEAEKPAEVVPALDIETAAPDSPICELVQEFRALVADCWKDEKVMAIKRRG